jgi:hypothetical protein
MANEDKLRDYRKQVTAKLNHASRRLREARNRARESISIAGTGCRFPGDARDPEGVCDLLAADADAIAGIPADRGRHADGLCRPLSRPPVADVTRQRTRRCPAHHKEPTHTDREW